MAEIWKLTSEEMKSHFREEAANLQREFKRQFPTYSYTKIRKGAKGTRMLERPFNSIFPPTTWEIPWDQFAPIPTE
jgi:hypothetical protein